MAYDKYGAHYVQAGTFFGNLWRIPVSGGSYRVSAYVDGVVQMTTTENAPISWTYPYDIQFMGETLYGESDVPGSPTTKEDFTAMGVQRYSDDTLVGSCGNVYSGIYYNTYYRYDADYVSCNHVRAWTR